MLFILEVRHGWLTNLFKKFVCSPGIFLQLKENLPVNNSTLLFYATVL